MIFIYGSKQRLREIQKKKKKKCDMNTATRGFEFGWLEQFFEKHHGSQCQLGIWLHYYGIVYYELDENKTKDSDT